MPMIRLAHFLLLLSFSLCIHAQYEVVKLWDKHPTRKEKRPELRIFTPADSLRNGTCVLICPGGSYHHLGLRNEGSEVAEYLRQWGITAVVLRYRVSMRGNHHPAMIEDFQRGVQILRENAEKFGIDPHKLGCMGFSAGGHLVTMGGAYASHDFLADRGVHTTVDLRPDFVCPIYPVVSMQDSIAHVKSRRNLLGKGFTKAMADSFSMERHIPENMPPVFLLACKDDDVVDYRNSVVLRNALAQKNIPCEFHLFEQGGHGFGMIRTRSEETNRWGLLLKKWLTQNGFLPNK